MAAPKTKKLSVYQQRVLIAKDVIKQVKARRYLADTGNIMSYDLRHSLFHADPLGRGSAQVALQLVKACEVCAKGACLLAYVERFNNVTTSRLRNTYYHTHLVDGFGNVFSAALLDEIETLFEKHFYGFESAVGRDLGLEIAIWAAKNLSKDESKRLIQIMRRLIKNKGRYVAFPEVHRLGKKI